MTNPKKKSRKDTEAKKNQKQNSQSNVEKELKAQVESKKELETQVESKKEAEPEREVEPSMNQASQDEDAGSDCETVQHGDDFSIASQKDEEVQSVESKDQNEGQGQNEIMNEQKDNMETTPIDDVVSSQEEEVSQTQESVEDRTILAPSEPAKAPINPGPNSRWGHTMNMIDENRAIIYGGAGHGKNGEETIFKDVYMFDFSKKSWSRPINCDGVARQWHSTTYIPERSLLISFGGETKCKKRGTKVTDQVMVLDTEIFLWYPPSCSGKLRCGCEKVEHRFIVFSHTLLGDSPTGRSGHSATILSNSQDMVIFGGVRSGRWTSTMAVLDTQRWRWTSPKTQGDAPRPRSYHSATAVPRSGKNWLVIFGGNNGSQSFNTVHCLETDGKAWTWINPVVSGDIPPPRTGHTATLLSDNKTLLVYGGWDIMVDDEGNDMVFEDAFLLDTETWCWKKSDATAKLWAGEKDYGAKRVGHTAALVNNEVKFFGGRYTAQEDAEFCSDMQMVKLS